MERSTHPPRSLVIATLEHPVSSFAFVDADAIVVRDAFNPRADAARASIDSLARSIAARGLLQPLVVCEPEPDVYHLIDGHRRLLACRKLGMAHVPVVVRDVSSDVDQLVDAVTTNSQREDLSLVEEARAYERMRLAGKPVKQIAAELAVSQRLVSSRLAMLTLPTSVLGLVDQGALMPGHLPTLIDMAKVSPRLAHHISSVIVAKDVSPARFAANPFHTVAQGHIPELDVWIVGKPHSVALTSLSDRLDDDDRARLREIGERRGTQTPTAITVDLEPGITYGCVYMSPEGPDAFTRKWAVCDADWMLSALRTSIVSLLTSARAATPAATGSSDGSAPAGVAAPRSEADVKAENKAARDADLEQRLRSHSANLNLGAEVFTRLDAVELTRDHALLLARLVVRDDASDLWLAGMRFCDPAVSTEVPSKSGPAKVQYELPAREEQAAALWAFVERGDDGPQVIGRLLQVLAMAGLALHDTVAQSSRPNRPAVARQQSRVLADMVGPRLPAPIRERLDVQLAAEAKLAADRAAYEQRLRDAEDLDDAQLASRAAVDEFDGKVADQEALAEAHVRAYPEDRELYVDLVDPVE